MSDIRADALETVATAAEVGTERLPAISPESYLTLSAGPEYLPVYSGALAVERLDRILRAERDPITPELLREKLSRAGSTGGLARRLTAAREAARARDPECVERAMWGDR